ncbi:uncharacterized protein LOC143543299 [Bidens hawaiensis]|uniref:uncharacterized protein LOC143543299 n=1 Tax=Bidens hawaiensis TaxID=980011 RepID=UPI00404A7F7E
MYALVRRSKRARAEESSSVVHFSPPQLSGMSTLVPSSSAPLLVTSGIPTVALSAPSIVPSAAEISAPKIVSLPPRTVTTSEVVAMFVESTLVATVGSSVTIPPPVTIPSTSEIPVTLDSERIAALERVVAKLSRIHLIQTQAIQRLVAENQIQSSLLIENGKLFDALKQFLASQRERSCKGDDLRTKRREDIDDDPNASEDAGGELPRTEQTLGASTSQGESTAPSGSAGGETIVVDDEDDTVEYVLSFSEIEKIGEQIEINSGLEEGEILDDSVSGDSEWEEQPR